MRKPRSSSRYSDPGAGGPSADDRALTTPTAAKALTYARNRANSRSSVTRRSSVARSASGEGCSPSRSSRSRTNASIAFRGHAASRSAGRSGRTGAMNDQCGSYCAPCSIQRLISATSRGSIGSFAKWHPPLGIGRGDAVHQGAAVGVAGRDYRQRALRRRGAGRRRTDGVRVVETQPRPPGAGIGTVARVAPVREDRPDVPVEPYRLRERLGLGGRVPSEEPPSGADHGGRDRAQPADTQKGARGPRDGAHTSQPPGSGVRPTGLRNAPERTRRHGVNAGVRTAAGDRELGSSASTRAGWRRARCTRVRDRRRETPQGQVLTSLLTFGAPAGCFGPFFDRF